MPIDPWPPPLPIANNRAIPGPPMSFPIVSITATVVNILACLPISSDVARPCKAGSRPSERPAMKSAKSSIQPALACQSSPNPIAAMRRLTRMTLRSIFCARYPLRMRIVVRAGRVMKVTIEAPPAWETRSQVVRVYFQWNFSEACFGPVLACVFPSC